MEHLERSQKITIMIAILAAMLFAALNQTIISTALPSILSALGGMEYLSWVFTIFMLTSSVTAILVGKLSDIYGRKPFILAGIVIFIVGSFLCGLAQNIIQLIIFRGIQGMGAGLILSTSFTAVGDLFAPKERGRWQGLMGGVFGLASVFGPTLGGFIVDHYDWHWIFWIFLPVGFVAFFLIWRMFPSTERVEGESIDYLGAIFITLTIVPMLLAFTWAGTQYSWSSSQILSLFGAAIVALVIFIVVELKARSPILPMLLFKNRIFSLANLIGFIMGAGMFGAIMYTPFFVQGVLGTSAAESGFVMMPMTLSMVVASALSGQLTSRTGKYKLLALSGLFIMSIGLFSMSMMSIDTSNTIAVINMIIVGFGLGIGMPIFVLAIQNAVEQKFLGVSTASTQLFRQIGGTIGVAVMGTIMSQRMASEIKSSSTEVNIGQETLSKLDPSGQEALTKLQNPQVLMDHQELEKIQSQLPVQLEDLFQNLVHMLREALSVALTDVFFAGGMIMLFAFLLTFFLKEIPLRSSNSMKVHTDAPEDAEKS